jgi:hypothetical protein
MNKRHSISWLVNNIIHSPHHSSCNESYLNRRAQGLNFSEGQGATLIAIKVIELSPEARNLVRRKSARHKLHDQLGEERQGRKYPQTEQSRIVNAQLDNVIHNAQSIARRGNAQVDGNNKHIDLSAISQAVSNKEVDSIILPVRPTRAGAIWWAGPAAPPPVIKGCARASAELMRFSGSLTRRRCMKSMPMGDTCLFHEEDKRQNTKKTRQTYKDRNYRSCGRNNNEMGIARCHRWLTWIVALGIRLV